MLTATNEKVVVVLTAVGVDATAATGKFQIELDQAYTLHSVTFQCDSANPPTGSAATLDVHKDGTTIFSTKPTIDAGESHSNTAAVASVLTTTPTVLPVGTVLRFDLDSIGATNAGQQYVATLFVTRSL